MSTPNKPSAPASSGAAIGTTASAAAPTGANESPAPAGASASSPGPAGARGEAGGGGDFIRQIIASDVAAGRNGGAVVTRFPPEPNGYLHVGHAKSIVLNFGVAAEFGGRCHLRMDDTNPSREDVEYVQAIMEDVRWLGFDWGAHFYHAADYFERIYLFAEELIGKGKAFVCDLSADELREYRGTLTEPGRPSPYRDRSGQESLDLFRRMRAGEFPNGARTLRARIDMASPNIVMRDPVLYRIQHSSHHRTGDAWCIYPMYDFAHCLSDAIEGVTHSICTLEFVPNRALYDWVLDNVDLTPLGKNARPRQYEFARLNLTRTVMSKRILRGLVEGGHVKGWDDPRMPTISGMRRRGYPPQALRAFCESIGVARRDNLVQLGQLEYEVRSELNRTAPRVMAVLRPLKVVIENWPEGQTDELEAINNPEDASAGTRIVPFGRELYIERDDFMEDPPKKFFRLAPGREVRLRYAYFITCRQAVKDEAGNIVELRCTYDPASRGGNSPDGRKVKATLHWVAAETAVQGEVRLYDTLFSVDNPAQVEEGRSPFEQLNAKSLEVIDDARLEPVLASATPGERYQFERLGYFCVDPDSTSARPVFNRTVTLKDEWANIQKRGE
ncbi:MAG TPA: glutamine--tRNA ligase/YqeY domain fusion protein [Candidatus Limnocylindrales bacterium]|nr:glutamine--tRNA ligase/YqeY domain fusion protein [Candidatus Limnocylindrales bacterium]